MTKFKFRDKVVHPHTGQVVEITAVRKNKDRLGREYQTYRVTGGCHFGAMELKPA